MSAIRAKVKQLQGFIHSKLHAVASPLKKVWDSPVAAWFLLAVTAFICARWFRHAPFPGYAIAFVAFVAAAISIRDNTAIQKVLWLCAIGTLLRIEFKAIKIDREATEREQEERFEAQEHQFTAIADRIYASTTQNASNFQAASKLETRVLGSAQYSADLAGNALAEITGENSYPYVTPTSPGPIVSLYVWNGGQHMLTNVALTFTERLNLTMV